MIIDNKVTEIGDELTIIGNVPIVGLIQLTSYIDTTVGETEDRYFDRKFQYSIDGINYSDFISLTVANILNIQVSPKDTFYIRYLYTRQGTDNTGELELLDISLKGQYVDFECGETFTKSVFYEYINCPDEEVLGWCVNVSEKLYKNIVPKYITRGETNSTEEDRDFIDLWRSITCFFAMIVIYSRRVVENFTFYPKILLAYIRQRNIIARDSEEVENIQYLKTNYYNEIRKRGTRQIIKEKSETTPIDGELLRLIEWENTDEFIFNLNRVENVGWNLGNSSPCYKGLTHIHNVIRGYEETEDVIDLSKYPLINSQNIEVVYDIGKHVMSIQTSETTLTGIGGDSKFIPVSNSLDYEITFYIKCDSNVSIDFGVKGFDINGQEQEFYSIFTGTANNWFLKNGIVLNTGKYYFIRGIIYNRMKNQVSQGDSVLNIGSGVNLKFSSSTVAIVPQLYITTYSDSSESQSESYSSSESISESESFSTSESTYEGINGNCFIWDFKVRPLRTGHSRGFIQVNNLIELWLKNNNQNYNLTDIQTIIERYLIPYNTNLKLIDLDEIYSDDKSISTSQSQSISSSESISESESTSSPETGDINHYNLYYENCCELVDSNEFPPDNNPNEIILLKP